MNKNCPYLEKKCEDIGCDCPKYLAYVDAQDPNKVDSLMKKYGFDTTLSAWNLMMQMQQSFEQRFHPMSGLSKEEQEHWIDRYLICIEDEIREVREHLSLFKSYTGKTNIIELRKEVIDLWHFVMDLYLATVSTPEMIKHAYEKYYDVQIDGDLIEGAYNIQKNTIDEYLYTAEDANKDITILKAACKLSDAGALVRQQISWKHWKKPNEKLNYERIYEGYAVVFHEIINLSILTMPVNEIKEIYMSKNIENIFRQEHGY